MPTALLLALLAAPPAGPPDFRIAYWYRRDDPIGTLKFRAYDVRKGQYDAKAVGAWLDVMRRDHPRYRAYVREVWVRPDETPSQKLAGAVIAEQMILGGPALDPVLDDARGSVGSESIRRLYRLPRASPRFSTAAPGHPRPLPGVGGSSFAPTNPSPFPMPYPRPHP